MLITYQGGTNCQSSKTHLQCNISFELIKQILNSILYNKTESAVKKSVGYKLRYNEGKNISKW